MGMDSRRYGYRMSLGGPVTPAIKLLLIANTAVFVLELLVPGEYTRLMVRWLGLVPRGVTHGGNIWQPFTYLFLHGDIWHLVFNMLPLWMFGCDLERVWGSRRFYIYYFLTGVGAGLINVVVKTIVDPAGQGSSLIPTIGASGAIYGVLMAAAMLFPDRRVFWLLPPVEMPMRVHALVMGAFAFFGAVSASRGDTVSHVSHLGGMLVGYLYLRRGSFFFSLRNRVSDWKRQRLRKRFEVYMRDHKGDPPSRPDRWVN